jgi:hypothetical protein
MGCNTCGPSVQAQCDCCLLVDNDKSFKVVVWCEDCQAYICKDCDRNWFKRGAAYLLRKFGRKVKAIAKPCEGCS